MTRMFFNLLSPVQGRTPQRVIDGTKSASEILRGGQTPLSGIQLILYGFLQLQAHACCASQTKEEKKNPTCRIHSEEIFACWDMIMSLAQFSVEARRPGTNAVASICIVCAFGLEEDLRHQSSGRKLHFCMRGEEKRSMALSLQLLHVNLWLPLVERPPTCTG